MSLTRRVFLGCAVGMVTLAGCTGGSPKMDVYSLRDGPVEASVQIIEATDKEQIVNENVIVETPSDSDDNAGDYDLMSGETYQITITTEDGLTGDYRWGIPSGAGERNLDIGIKRSEIKFVVSMP